MSNIFILSKQISYNHRISTLLLYELSTILLWNQIQMQIQSQNEAFKNEISRFCPSQSRIDYDNFFKNQRELTNKQQISGLNQSILQQKYLFADQQNNENNLLSKELLTDEYHQKVNFHNYSYKIGIFQEQLLFLKSSWQKNEQFQAKIKLKNNKMSKMINLTQDAINALNIQIQKLTHSYKSNKHQKHQKNILVQKKFDQRLQKQKQKLSLYQNYQYLQNQYQNKIQIQKQISLIVEQTKKINNLNKLILQKIKQKQKAITQKYQTKQKIISIKKNYRSNIKQISQKIKQCDYEEFQITQNINKLSQSKEHIENQRNELQSKNYQIDRMYQQIKTLTNQHFLLQNQKKDLQLFYKKIKKQEKEMLKTIKIQEQCQAEKIKYQQQMSKPYVVVESDQQSFVNKNKNTINQVEEYRKNQNQSQKQQKQDVQIRKLVQRYQEIKKYSHEFY